MPQTRENSLPHFGKNKCLFLGKSTCRLQQENISSIMLNDLFSYRFFLAVHSKTVQNEKLVSQPMNFRNIYYLEKLWMDYRKLKKLPIHNEDNCLEKACSAEIYKEIMKNYERNLKGGE